jgi:hypothetical protein
MVSPIVLILAGMVWDMYLPGRIYNCTDFNSGFFMPACWVHGNYVTVDEVNPHDSMSLPDSIKKGWSVGKLWLLWFSFVAVFIAISRLLAFVVGCLFKDKAKSC